jgi:hypothetical protein
MNAILPTATFLTVNAIKAWQPDPNCIRAGDEHVTLAVRCYAAGGLSDVAIAQRIRLFGDYADLPDIERCDAAVAVARHGAIAGASPREIVEQLARLALEVPCWLPDDPEQIAALTAAAMREAGR